MKDKKDSWHIYKTLDPNVLICSPHRYGVYRAPAFKIFLQERAA